MSVTAEPQPTENSWHLSVGRVENPPEQRASRPQWQAAARQLLDGADAEAATKATNLALM
jgi:hypothetical protein